MFVCFSLVVIFIFYLFIYLFFLRFFFLFGVKTWSSLPAGHVMDIPVVT